MKRKAQSSMEYLITYGWAIVIVIIVAAVLYALGVFNPDIWRETPGTQVINVASEVTGSIEIPDGWHISDMGFLERRGDWYTTLVELSRNDLPWCWTISRVHYNIETKEIVYSFHYWSREDCYKYKV